MTTVVDVKMTLPYALRALAKAIDERDAMLRSTALSEPSILWTDGDRPLDMRSASAVLLVAIEDEIRRDWDRLRGAAFERNANYIEELRAQIIAALTHYDPRGQKAGG